MQKYEEICFPVYNRGGNLSRYNRLFVFFDVCQSKARSGYGVFPVSKAMVWLQKSYGMTSNESFYLRLKMNIRLREISAQLNIRKCFFEHESHESNESFRLRHGIYSWDSGDYFPLVSGSSTNLVVKNQPQAVTLANPSEIPLNRKRQRSKKDAFFGLFEYR